MNEKYDGIIELLILDEIDFNKIDIKNKLPKRIEFYDSDFLSETIKDLCNNDEYFYNKMK